MNYSKTTKAELLRLCMERGLEADESLRKQDLITLLEQQNAEDRGQAMPGGSKNEKEAKAESKGKAGQPSSILSRNRLKKASIKHSDKIFRSDGNLTVDSKDKFAPELTDEELDDRELVLSQSNDIIQTGRILHITQPIPWRTKSGKDIVTAFAIIKKRVRSIFIPIESLFDNYDDITDECKTEFGEVDKNELAKRISKYLGARLGSEVDYIVTGAQRDDDGTVKYIASRTKAMEKERETYWFSRQNDRDEYGNYKYRINVGDTPEGRIVAVTKNNIIIDIFGVECIIYRPDVSYEFIPDLREKYRVGGKEKVVITDIIRNFENKKVKVKGSIKEGKNDPFVIHYDDYNRGDKCLGKITNIRDSDNDVLFFVNDMGTNVTIGCYLNDGIAKIPEIGDEVEFMVNGKNFDEHKIWGKITHIF